MTQYRVQITPGTVAPGGISAVAGKVSPVTLQRRSGCRWLTVGKRGVTGAGRFAFHLYATKGLYGHSESDQAASAHARAGPARLLG